MPPVRRPLRQARPPAGARVARARRVGQLTVGVVNFKSIASVQVEPKRLTVIAGSNSSGKSSLLQAMLFAAQSFGEPTPVINGDLVQLGEAGDVLRDGTHDLTFEFLYPEATREESGEITADSIRSLRITLAAQGKSEALAAQELSLWRASDCICKAIRVDGIGTLPLSGEEHALEIAEPAALDLPDESYVTVSGITPSSLIYRADEAELDAVFNRALESGRDPRWLLEELNRSARVVGVDPFKVEHLTDLTRQVAQQGLQSLSKVERGFLFDIFRESEAPAGWVTEPIAGAPRGRSFWRVGGAHGRPERSYLAREIGRAIDQVERLADAILYLGPLRDDPRVAYPLGHTVRALPVGEKGEFTAAYLRENSRARFRFGRPDGSETLDSMPNAVNLWCEYLGIADRIKVTPQGKLGHQLGLRVGGRDRDPTAIGVGASQLLPVVVMVLGAPEGSVVLLEQPELHLHPKVQSRLADFLAYARRNIRVIVETHSEYLITRLRLRIAEGKLNQDELAVLFAKQRIDEGSDGQESVHTVFDHLSVDELGDFDCWPEGFFDTLDRDTVALAQAIAQKYKDDPGLSE